MSDTNENAAPAAGQFDFGMNGNTSAKNDATGSNHFAASGALTFWLNGVVEQTTAPESIDNVFETSRIQQPSASDRTTEQ